MTDKLNINLQDNCLDSLQQGLKHYYSAQEGKAREYKYAALNFAMYIELSFKYFISKIHPILIFKSAFKETAVLKNTISLQESTNFIIKLEQFNSIDNKGKDFFKNIDWLRDKCNEIKHYEVNFDVKEFNEMISKILSTLDSLYDEREISISNKLETYPINLAEFYDTIIDEYEHKLRVAQNEAKNSAKSFEQVTKDDIAKVDQDDALIDCPSCGGESTFILKENIGKYICTYCEHDSPSGECEWCSKIFPISEAFETIEDTHWCSDPCLDRSKHSKGCL